MCYAIRHMRRVAPLLLVLALGCAAAHHDYPPEMVDTFIRGCTTGGQSEAVCRCSLDRIQSRYTLEEYRALEQRVARGTASPAEIVQLTAECRR